MCADHAQIVDRSEPHHLPKPDQIHHPDSMTARLGLVRMGNEIPSNPMAVRACPSAPFVKRRA
ncbi:MAG: hypothetical protein G8237_01340 [Magnetococcales bacterium]|nr:hypothetical protein [Magnetococcales bacterium]NGZ04981.1 hypothetical protein [Magnetococcales bacterium]